MGSIRGLPAILAVTFAAFGGWSLLLPVVPLALSRSGQSDAVAGASTAIFMATTVAAQLAAPKLLRRCGYRVVIGAGCVFLGLPAFALAATVAPMPALAVSGVRGIGFGLLTVAGAAYMAELAPRDLLGRATALQGISAAVAQMVTLPLGLAAVEWFTPGPVFVAGAIVPLVAVLGVGLMPDVRPEPGGGVRALLPYRRLALPLLTMLVVAGAFGGLSSLVPIATDSVAVAAGIALAVHSAAMVAGRYVGGALADRLGPGRMLGPALLLAAAGLVLVAYAVRAQVSVVALVLGAGLYGCAFGIVQNDSLVQVFTAAGQQRIGAASAAWNIAYDGGTGAGALSLGVAATFVGYPWVFGCTAAFVALVAATTLKA